MFDMTKKIESQWKQANMSYSNESQWKEANMS